MTQSESGVQRTRLLFATLTLSTVAIALALFAVLRSPPQAAPAQPATSVESSFQKSKRERVLKVGYGPFPPYVNIDPNEKDESKRLSGLCVDMINEIAARQQPPWRVEWHKVSWEAFRADMYSGKFDVLPNAIYQTVPRASEFRFTEPFTYVGVAVGVVRADETRFKTFMDLDKAGVKVSLAEGWTATEYARQRLNKDRLLVKPIGDDLNAQLNDLLSGRADAVLQDTPTALTYLKARPKEIKLLWIDNPPMRLAASFITRFDDEEMVTFLNTAIRVMQSDGTVERLDRKWNGMGEYLSNSYRPGAGLVAK
jgi:ABC-type amino acid transport substrate-binding protein